MLSTGHASFQSHWPRASTCLHSVRRAANIKHAADALLCARRPRCVGGTPLQHIQLGWLPLGMLSALATLELCVSRQAERLKSTWSRLVDWLVGRSVGRLVGWWVDWVSRSPSVPFYKFLLVMETQDATPWWLVARWVGLLVGRFLVGG